MERKYSLNEVDNFISKYRNKKNINLNNNSQKNDKDIDRVLSNNDNKEPNIKFFLLLNAKIFLHKKLMGIFSLIYDNK